MYALVVDKGGPKFKEASLNFRRTGPRPGDVMFRAAPATQEFKGATTMAKLAHFHSGRLDRKVSMRFLPAYIRPDAEQLRGIRNI